MKNAEILQNHQYKIWQGNNQKWYTYLPDEKMDVNSEKPTRQPLKKQHSILPPKSQKRRTQDKTFKDAYDHWQSVHDTLVCHNTVCKYNTDCKDILMILHLKEYS